MKIDHSKLKKVVTKKDGKIEAQCPACAAEGHDTTGNHLIVYPEGKFGCVTNPKDTEHNKKVLALAGTKEASGCTARNVVVRAFKAPPSTKLMDVPRRTLAQLSGKRGEEPKEEPVR